MYLSYYGLGNHPFTISPDPNFLYLSEVHKEGLAHLTYGVSQRKGFVVITGEVGTGKTTLIHALLANIPQKVRLAFISNPTLTRDDFFYLLADAYQLGAVDNKARFLIEFTHFLEKAYEQDENVVLIVDEAHCLTEELLEEIRLLSNLETPHNKLVNIILVGQPELDAKLKSPKLRPLKQRITLYYHLPSMNREETVQYVKNRLLKAGAGDLGIFSDRALELIYDYTKGVPRLINILCDRCLLTGFVKNCKCIDDTIIEECAQELNASNKTEKDRRKSSGLDTSGNKFGFLFQFIVILILAIAGFLIVWLERTAE